MPSLSGYAPLDVAIGLVLVYLLFSTLCSAVQEGIASVLDWRAATLEEALRKMLDDDGKAGTGAAPTSVDGEAGPPAAANADDQGKRTSTPLLSEQLLGHALVRGLYTDAKHTSIARFASKRTNRDSDTRRGPSYLSSKTFALALLDIAAPETGPDPIASVVEEIEGNQSLPESVKSALLGLAKGAAKDRDHLRSLVEGWFNDTMERVSGWYKRKAQVVICAISLLVAVGLNVNTIGIGERLAKDDSVRAAVVAQAQKTTTQTANVEKAAENVRSVQQLGVPIGWDKRAGDPAQASFTSLGGGIRTVGGWLLTFLALSLGAPFWFGLLGKLTSLRSSGGTAEPKKSG